MPPTASVAEPLPLKVPVEEGLLVKALRVIAVPGPVRLVLLGKVIEKVELELPVRLNLAVPPVVVLDKAAPPVAERAPAVLMTTVPAVVPALTVPKTRSAVLVIVTGARMVTVLLAVALAACAAMGILAAKAA